MHALPLPIRTLSQEGPFQASKWLKIQVLMDEVEMQSLLEELAGVRIFPISGVVEKSKIEVSKQEFINVYSSWIEKLRKGSVPTQEELKQIVSCVWTVDLEALYLMQLQENRFLTKVKKPAILVQAHFMGYSKEEETFRPMIFGEKSLFWGLQFSFPQIFQRPDTKEFVKVDRSEEFRNTALFSQLRKWMRDHTRPTPFCMGTKKVCVPMRLGKQCSWMNAHPQLQQHRLKIYVD